MPKMFSLGLFFFPITVPNEASVCGNLICDPQIWFVLWVFWAECPSWCHPLLPAHLGNSTSWLDGSSPSFPRTLKRGASLSLSSAMHESRWANANKWTHRTPQSLIKVQISCKENTLKGHFRRAAMGDTRWLSEENGANAAVSSTKLSFFNRPGSKVTICADREAGRRCAAGKLNANEESEPGNLVRADRDWMRLKQRGKLSRRISRRCCYFKGFSRPGGDYLRRRF